MALHPLKKRVLMKTPLQAAKPALSLITLNNLPIFEQLQLEEALLRADVRNWCLINHGTSPAIVMGISGRPELLVNRDVVQKKGIPIIRRFSGGGTVYVDSGTHFVTWIFNTGHIEVDCCPAKVHHWTADFFREAMPTVDVALRENDYVIGERKWGGNAQYLCKGRWLHHSSILWDYDDAEMGCLLLPSKMPSYRQQRSHSDFLCRLRDHLPCRKFFQGSLIEKIKEKFDVTVVSLEQVLPILTVAHRKSVCYLKAEWI